MSITYSNGIWISNGRIARAIACSLPLVIYDRSCNLLGKEASRKRMMLMMLMMMMLMMMMMMMTLAILPLLLDLDHPVTREVTVSISVLS